MHSTILLKGQSHDLKSREIFPTGWYVFGQGPLGFRSSYSNPKYFTEGQTMQGRKGNERVQLGQQEVKSYRLKVAQQCDHIQFQSCLKRNKDILGKISKEEFSLQHFAYFDEHVFLFLQKLKTPNKFLHFLKLLQLFSF